MQRKFLKFHQSRLEIHKYGIIIRSNFRDALLKRYEENNYFLYAVHIIPEHIQYKI